MVRVLFYVLFLWPLALIHSQNYCPSRDVVLSDLQCDSGMMQVYYYRGLHNNKPYFSTASNNYYVYFSNSVNAWFLCIGPLNLAGNCQFGMHTQYSASAPTARTWSGDILESGGAWDHICGTWRRDTTARFTAAPCIPLPAKNNNTMCSGLCRAPAGYAVTSSGINVEPCPANQYNNGSAKACTTCPWP
jgi:hypothetical protein